MDLSIYIPPNSIWLLWSLFAVLRFENQRWIRSIAGGRMGEYPLVPLIVNLTGFLGLVLIVAVLGASIWYGGWQAALGLLIIGFVSSLIAGALIGLITGGDNFFFWMLATIGMWPVGFFLTVEVIAQFG